ncbi:hypothetical protein [Halobaculum sp. EA56]|uniref:hypothetical protein n=1 Tax=Halobaculum sp. EA56 TaxID=3421648 RepID=UPI003EBE40E1
MNRRTFLATVGASTSITAVSGCTQLSKALPGCDDMDSTTVDRKPVSLSDEQVSNILPLMYTELQAEQQQIIDEASGDGRYKACPPIPDSAETFIDLAKERIDRQWEEFSGNPENRPDYLRTAYLNQDSEYFELQITIEDMVIS